jgi:hypothetical protein
MCNSVEVVYMLFFGLCGVVGPREGLLQLLGLGLTSRILILITFRVDSMLDKL